MFQAFLDTDSLAEIVRLAGFQALLDPEIQQALVTIAQLLVKSAQDNTYLVFDNPTGVLASSINATVLSQYEMAISVDVPYGHRREYSFKGPDSLGRMYPNDIPRPYLIPAMEENEDTAQAILEAAVLDAMGRIP